MGYEDWIFSRPSMSYDSALILVKFALSFLKIQCRILFSRNKLESSSLGGSTRVQECHGRYREDSFWISCGLSYWSCLTHWKLSGLRIVLNIFITISSRSNWPNSLSRWLDGVRNPVVRHFSIHLQEDMVRWMSSLSHSILSCLLSCMISYILLRKNTINKLFKKLVKFFCFT